MASSVDKIAAFKQEGKTIVFTNGVFDILHRGHVTYLTEAKKLGDVLVLGLNDDASVRRLGKGDDRPINSEEDRKVVLEALRAIDVVIIFTEDTPLNLINQVQPDVLVKGGDYDPDETNAELKTYIVGSKEVRESGGQVSVINFVDGYSTTKTVAQIKSSGQS